MKKVVLLSILMVLSTILFSQYSLEKSESGDYRMVSEYKTLGIEVIADAKYYERYFNYIIANPNTPVLIEETEVLRKFYKDFTKTVSVEKKEIVYLEDDQKIKLIYSQENLAKPSLLILILYSSILLMVVSNLLSFFPLYTWTYVYESTRVGWESTGYCVYPFALAIYSFLLAAFAAFVPFLSSIDEVLVVIVGFVVVLGGLVITALLAGEVKVEEDESKLKYWIASAIYYVLVGAYLILI